MSQVRQRLDDLKKLDAEVLVIDAHDAMRARRYKNGIDKAFSVLSDPAARVSARYGVALMDEDGDFPAAHAALERAYAIGEKLGNARLMARALAHRA